MKRLLDIIFRYYICFIRLPFPASLLFNETSYLILLSSCCRFTETFRALSLQACSLHPEMRNHFWRLKQTERFFNREMTWFYQINLKNECMHSYSTHQGFCQVPHAKSRQLHFVLSHILQYLCFHVSPSLPSPSALHFKNLRCTPAFTCLTFQTHLEKNNLFMTFVFGDERISTTVYSQHVEKLKTHFFPVKGHHFFSCPLISCTFYSPLYLWANFHFPVYR